MKVNPFTLNTGDDSFQERQKNVFDQLGVLEQDRSSNSSISNTLELDEPPDERNIEKYYNRRSERTNTSVFKGKESIFKQPQNPRRPNFLRNIPDFKKNPHKWTKYSLEDVRDEDISEEGNTRAALSFLKEIEDRKKKQNQTLEDLPLEELPTKITFNNSASSSNAGGSNKVVEKAAFQGSKFVMPEYVVGQSSKNKRKIGKEKVVKGKELKLDHLYGNEDDSE